MRRIRATLAGDGSSDRRLLHPIRWLAQRYPEPEAFELDPSFAAARRGTRLEERIADALHDYPCDLLLVHRDAEKQDPRRRRQEIAAVLDRIPRGPRYVAVVPVRMSEAWLLGDASAIARAADNPAASPSLDLPKPKALEGLANPKDVLREAILQASGLRGRRRALLKRDLPSRMHRVAALTDYEPVRKLPAFAQLETDLYAVLREMLDILGP